MAQGVKRYRVHLRAVDALGLKQSLGHRLEPEGMRMRLAVPPLVDTPVEIQLCFADGRVAMVGRGWVSTLHEEEARLELEWEDGAEPGLVTWLFGQESPGARTVRFEDLESPDEVPLVLSEAPTGGQRLEPLPSWALARPLPSPPLEKARRGSAEPCPPSAEPCPPSAEPCPPSAEPCPPSAEPCPPSAEPCPPSAAPCPPSAAPCPPSAEPCPPSAEPWARVGGSTPEVDLYEEETPIALTDVVEQAQADLEAQIEPPTDRLGTWTSDALEDEAHLSPPGTWAREVEEQLHVLSQASRAPEAGAPGSASMARDSAEGLSKTGDGPEPEPLPLIEAPLALFSPEGPILAYDIGTSMTSVAVSEEGEIPRLLPSEDGADAVPSVVVLEPGGRTFAGAPALRALAASPERGVVGTKRLLGRSYWSPVVRRVEAQLPWRVVPGAHGEAAAQVGDRVVSLEEVAALILRRAGRNAQVNLRQTSNRAILTCPAYFGARQRRALAEAGRIAGLHVERVLSCCLAAAVHHVGAQELNRHRLLVFDLGAGTLDVALVEVSGKRFVSLAAGGHPLLGGIDFDAAVAHLLLATLGGRATSLDASSEALMSLLGVDQADPPAPEGSGLDLSLPDLAGLAKSEGPDERDAAADPARQDAEALWSTLVDKALSITREVCRRAGVVPTEVEEIVVVGGQARASYVHRRLTEFFKKPCTPVNHRAAVALGAAEVGRRLAAREEGFAVKESLPASFGVGASGGGFTPIVRRDSKLPASGEAFLVLSPRAPTELLLYEGDHVRVDGCEPYARVRLDPLPKGQEDDLAIELHVRIDDQGTVALEVLRGASHTAVPHVVDPWLSPEDAARVLAVRESTAQVEPSELGFLDWLRRKLRG